jgi:hypothetical protein
MAIISYQVTGPTYLITATSTSSQINITPAEAGVSFTGKGGPFFLKITNGSSSENIYFSTGLTTQTAVIPTGDGVLAGSCVIPAYAEVIVQVENPNDSPATIYVAAVASSSSPVFITPVAIVG